MILDELKTGGKAAMAKALGMIETDPYGATTIALLDTAFHQPLGRVIGLTGPPGVGKSTLMNALIRHWRQSGLTVGCIAVDPSSRKSRGALLGDRTRLSTAPEDQGIFFRSMAARDQLGGLAALTVSAMVLMRAVYDIVLIETVGVGQSETDVAHVADTVLFCVQPGSGDSLQFMKAGIAEIPHVVAVTKADMEQAAVRARADVKGALTLSAGDPDNDWEIPVVLVSARGAHGVEALTEALDRHWRHLNETGRRERARHDQAQHWLEETVSEEWGRKGLTLLRNQAVNTRPMLALNHETSPFKRLAEISGQIVLKYKDQP